ncbi:hypothetical protein PWG14_16965 (plasmid) [Chromobacterium amazonense]|uniref:hypothetical protein n=1 Tax=Chromobacterium amazonense TaxID=1382803 RepID=UPI00237DE9CB|nr:hypothetical protein [Chromobacterium amazonense]MDE1714222.1 hypothetical protein [Chromobacterium amazonense]
MDLESSVRQQLVGAVDVAFAQMARAALQLGVNFAPDLVETMAQRGYGSDIWVQHFAIRS